MTMWVSAVKLLNREYMSSMHITVIYSMPDGHTVYSTLVSLDNYTNLDSLPITS